MKKKKMHHITDKDNTKRTGKDLKKIETDEDEDT